MQTNKMTIVEAKEPFVNSHSSRAIRAGNKTYDVVYKCYQENFDPVENLIQLFKEETTDTTQKIDICKTLLSYMAPKVRSVIHSGKVDITHEQVIKGLMGIKEEDIIDGHIEDNPYK